MKKYSARLATLWQDFETRSDSLAEALEQQMDKTKSVPVSKETEKEMAVRKYRKELVTHVEELCKNEFRAKFDSEEKIGKFAEESVDKKYLPAEVKSHEAKKGPWKMFRLSERTKEAVKDNIKKKMVTLTSL